MLALRETTPELATYMLMLTSYPTSNLVANSTNRNKLAAVTFTFVGLSHFEARTRFPKLSLTVFCRGYILHSAHM